MISNTEHKVGLVEPLGIFGAVVLQPPLPALKDKLRTITNQIPPCERERIARYLRGGTAVFSIMEYTVDVIEKRFGVSGGSSIITDGKYYWRRDTADYVEHYGVGLPTEFLQYARSMRWLCPPVSKNELSCIEEFLLTTKFKFRSE